MYPEVVATPTSLPSKKSINTPSPKVPAAAAPATSKCFQQKATPASTTLKSPSVFKGVGSNVSTCTEAQVKESKQTPTSRLADTTSQTKSAALTTSSNSTPPLNKSMSKADRHEVKKILESKSSIMEKASRRASALNMTRLCPTLVLATGSSTLSSKYIYKFKVKKIKCLIKLPFQLKISTNQTCYISTK